MDGLPVALFVDVDGLQRALQRSHQHLPSPADLGEALVRHCRDRGQLTVARAYGDWTTPQADPRAIQEQGLEPVLVMPSLPGATLAALAFDVAQHVFADSVDGEVVLVGGDAGLGQVARRARGRRQWVTLVTPQTLAQTGLATSAHELVSLDDLLQGEGASPTRGASGTELASDYGSSGGGDGNGRLELEDFDWSRFVRLVAWLEQRLPFVGVGYLIKKAMTPENVGTADPRDKQAIFQQAEEMGLVEVYYKENIDEQGDPVAACRLQPDHELVSEVLETLEAEPG
jgi:hypothetical protein